VGADSGWRGAAFRDGTEAVEMGQWVETFSHRRELESDPQVMLRVVPSFDFCERCDRVERRFQHHGEWKANARLCGDKRCRRNDDGR